MTSTYDEDTHILRISDSPADDDAEAGIAWPSEWPKPLSTEQLVRRDLVHRLIKAGEEDMNTVIWSAEKLTKYILNGKEGA